MLWGPSLIACPLEDLDPLRDLMADRSQCGILTRRLWWSRVGPIYPQTLRPKDLGLIPEPTPLAERAIKGVKEANLTSHTLCFASSCLR